MIYCSSNLHAGSCAPTSSPSCGVSTCSPAKCNVSAVYDSRHAQPQYYNITCSPSCSKWLFYIKEISPPLLGKCADLPCVVDSTSWSDPAVPSVSPKYQSDVGKWTAINATVIDTAVMAVRCITSCNQQDSFSNEVVLRISNLKELPKQLSSSAISPSTPTNTESSVVMSLMTQYSEKLSSVLIQPTQTTAYVQPTLTAGIISV